MRADGKRLKHVDPMYSIAPFIMDKRYDAQNMITLDIPVEPMRKYMNKVRQEGHKITHLGLLLAAYVRTVAEYPALNRFVVNKRVYARTELPVGMVVLQPGSQDHGTMSKIYFDVTDDVFTVQQKLDDYVTENRESAENNGTEKIMKVLKSIPGLVPVGVWVLRRMDRHGWLPKKIIDASPFHISLVISNLASIHTNHIYHHVYEFGTTSIAITMGNLREVPVRRKGEIVFERCLPLGVVMDERICSGGYFAVAFRRFSEYLKNPELLEGPPAVVHSDLE